MTRVPDHAELTKIGNELAKRAVDELNFVTEHETPDDGREVLRRDDGASLSFQVTDERVGDAYTVIVDIDYNLTEGEAGTAKQVTYLWVVFAQELTTQLYDEKIVPWASQNEVR